LIIAGNEDMYGASYLCSKAAFSMGVGLVKIITTKSNKELLNDKLPEAIVISYSDKTDEELQRIVSDELKWCDTVLVGPGLGVGTKAARLIGMCIGSFKKLIIDADGINILAMNPALKEKLHSNIILTPHLGEAHRLCGLSIKNIQDDMFLVCSDLVNKFRVSCVLKDARSVIINSRGEKYINVNGNSGMAKAGSGDVLAGIIAGLVTTGMEINDASAYGPFIHGLVGDIASEEHGEYGMLPTDMIKAIKEIFV
jgi:NAD(P)H-hydrate epimerase